ncbi:OmpH family outer membrane protein [Rhodospirillaceae bacterium KN72]|uniref:OmpH family outer membrane protein n=1 Tax=Pacificispira spongiicola TaxID=2729598 RepID=A0A7Y0DYN0_9PROT|nr:OmpH family outer membrane protein [Pacificispira spongiicola]NMM44029.1 OmpH family outer membrane protein [Pacificispira spongiicola]
MTSGLKSGKWRQSIITMRNATAAALALSTVCFAAPQSFAQDVEPLHAAVVDSTRIQAEALVWKDLRVKFKAENDRMVEELRKTQSELEEEGRALSEQQSILAPEAFAAKRDEFEAKLRKQNQVMGQRKQILESALNEAQRRISEQMQEIVVEIADEMNLNLVLDGARNKSAIVYARADIDITKDIIKRLDERLQKVNFTPIVEK